MRDGKLDWTKIRLRLEKAGAAIESGYSPNPEDMKKILKARAHLLARAPEETKHGEVIEVLEFLLANECYAVETQFVREVYTIKDYTPLPGTPLFILGLINVRGQIVSVIDIKKFFDMPDKGISDLNKAVIIHDDTMEFGVLADSMLGVLRISMNEIQPPLPTLTGIREQFLKGVTPEGIVILDARKLLADKTIILNEET
ncbi:MAG: chemotaxis protein CheW [Syntrophorhabdales bacterium]|jgi:purine-binding chemotaxis protein CheW